MSALVERILIISAIAAIVTYLVGSTTAILLYPNYAFFSQYFSDLGVGPTALIFNITVILTGIFLFPIFPLAFYLLKPSKMAKIALLLSTMTGVVTSLFLIFVGIFDKEGKSDQIHSFVATGFFVSMTISIIFWIIGNYLRDKELSPYETRSRAKGSVISKIIVLLFPLIFILATGTFNPALQKIVVYFFLAYFGFTLFNLNLGNDN